MRKWYLFVVVLVGVMGITYLFLPPTPDRTVYPYLPELEKFALRHLQLEKLYADPSYQVPYTVLIRFETDAPGVFEGIGLKGIESVDTVKLKRTSWVEEYQLYFTMESVNVVRSVSMSKEIAAVRWWDIKGCNELYAAPFLDNGTKKSVVAFGQKKNGRIVCCKDGTTYFILIECWG